MRLLIAVVIVVITQALSGCAAVVVSSAAVGALSVNEDQRSLGMQLDDTTNASKLSRALSEDSDLDEHARINVHLYNNSALLVGQAPTKTLIIRAENIAKNTLSLNKLHNQIRLGSPTAATTRAHDVWLKSKIVGNLLSDKTVNSLQIDVIVEDSEVFLMGIVDNNQASKIVEIVRNIDGVIKVVSIFEIQ
ncbi:MAG: BON domain-containing protein [Alteromonadaceae bacterium]|nr:BON domain-containing protein [Alteromonadaceae bacterium]